MPSPAHLIGHDYFVYLDLIAVVIFLCLCMLACSLRLAYQKRSARFIGTVWAGFLVLVLLGSLGLIFSIHAQRHSRRDFCSRLVASYADTMSELNHEKIVPGNPEVFSDWSEPFLVPTELQDAFPTNLQNLPWRTPVSHDHDSYNLRSDVDLAIPQKLATPEGLTGGWQDLIPFVPPRTDAPLRIQRRNQWAVARLTGDSKAYDRCTKAKGIVVQWEPVPRATTYRLQWGEFHGDDTEWMTVYSGAVPYCELIAPEGVNLALRVRAEDGTPEGSPDFNRIARVLDFAVQSNVFVAYAYTMRVSDDQHVQFIASTISDANKNGFIDAGEVPVDIGEFFTFTELLKYIYEHKTRAMSFAPFDDQWGRWFYIAEPIWTSDGKMDGVMAMDFDVAFVHRHMFRERIYPLCLFVLVTFFYFGAVLVINRLQIESATINQLATELQGTVSELTEAKQVTEKALMTKTLFLTNMSHEFRTPLNAMLGFTEILSLSSQQCVVQDTKIRCVEAIGHMKESGRSLLEMIDHVLGVAAMDEGQSPRVTVVPVHLRRLILEVADMMRSRAELKSLALEVSEQSSIPEWISSDPAHIRQVLIHLVGNAVKFTSQGSISIRFGMSADESMVSISVSDTGIGIGSEHLKSIFKPFSQTDPSLTRRYGGTGIGLSVARQSAEMLNGTISVESQPDQGSIFTFTFPCRAAEVPNG